eukprot:CAMPEP_0184495196 /NCGR_PEP_ID=MMETSP0113_2-20130426/30619_1 /TAXON_ID=91329 /ORGANISM="Norrisiella sphaerica, Strain BC52" /LENGTH=360 /DNA_ID=CAMNT_0026881267 /DNA_START=264 /DNA_END=1346 /DNA_ORIENTATION=-
MDEAKKPRASISMDHRRSAELEMGKQTAPVEGKVNGYCRTQEAAGLLLFASFSVAGEAFVVWFQSGADTPTEDLGGSSAVYAPGAILGAAAGEISLVLGGVLLSSMALFFDIHIPTLTLGAAIASLIIGWFYFGVSTIGQPVFNFKNDLVPPLPPLGGWDSEFREEVTFYMGYLIPQMVICAIALGLHFFALLELWRAQSRTTNAKKNSFADKCRAMYYSTLVALLGAGILTSAAWTRLQEGPERLERLVIYPPSIIVYPDVAVMTGVFLSVYGLLGMLGALYFFIGQDLGRFKTIVRDLKFLGFLLYFWIFGFHVMAQIGLAGAMFAGDGARIALLFFPVALTPAYFAHRVWRKASEEI